MKEPRIHPSCYIAPTAVIIGDVEVGPDCSVWDHATIRGDLNSIVIGEGSNVQEHVAIHVTPENPTTIGRDVSIGHNAVVHAATIEAQCIVGMHSTVLDRSVIGRYSIIGANAMVREGFRCGEMSLVVGVPAKIIREGDERIREATLQNARNYHRLREEHRKGEHFRYEP